MLKDFSTQFSSFYLPIRDYAVIIGHPVFTFV